MRLLKLSILFFFTFFINNLFTQDYKNQYDPKIGDDVILVTHNFQKGKLKDARTYFTTTFMNNLKNDKIIRDTYFLENNDIDELVIISFASPAAPLLNFKDDFYQKEIKSMLKAMSTSINFQLVAVNNEPYEPKVNDMVVIWEYNVKEKSLDKAVDFFKKDVYPLMAKDKYSRDSYLLSFKLANILVGITMLTGDYEEVKKVQRKLDELNKFLTKPAKYKSYKIIALRDQ